MKYALVQFRIYLLGEKPFAIYTDHASLRTATKSPHLSQRMARWLSFFSEYNFVVHYKPGKTNILADALSRRPDYQAQSSSALINHLRCIPLSPIPADIKASYQEDNDCRLLLDYFLAPNKENLAALTPSLRARLHRYHFRDDLLYYQVDSSDPLRIVVPNDDSLKLRILGEFHDCPTAGHLGREKTFLAITRHYYWPNQYRWVRKYIRTCEICQRVKPSGHSQAPLHSLQIPMSAWKSISMDFIFGLPADKHGRNGILVFVDRFSKMVHLVPVADTISAEDTAQIFVNVIFRLHGMPNELVSDRDPRFTSRFWRAVFSLLGTRLAMSTAYHPQTDGQTERVNRVLEDVLRSYATSFIQWSDFLPLAEFALNNSVHASTGLTPFFVCSGQHPQVPALLSDQTLTLSEGGKSDDSDFILSETPVSDISDMSENHFISDAPKSDISDSENPNLESHSCEKQSMNNKIALRRSSRHRKPVSANNIDIEDVDTFAPLSPLNACSTKEKRVIDDFILNRQATVRFVRDAIASAVDRQKASSDKHGRSNKSVFKKNELVLLSTLNLPKHAVSNLGSTKLLPRFIGPFKVLERRGDAYKLDIPSYLKLHPTFYVGRLKAYHQHSGGIFIPPSSSSSPRAHPKRNLVDDVCEKQANAASNDQQMVDIETIPSAPPAESCLSSPAHAEDQQHSFEDHQRVPSKLSSRSRELESVESFSPTDLPPYRAPPPLLDKSNVPHWIVEKILDHEDRLLHPPPLEKVANCAASHQNRTHKKHRYYLVRWLGFPPESDSWEPSSVLKVDVPDIVQEYEHSLCSSS